ncbi:unnamed protein product [Clavelina lepadiformis]|uniref:Y+L amino acid transporter 2 n=1 Tax=Clavelina lepadiformis TaxID=159417 RepID=A0ABP0GIK2_CLALP
MDNNEKGSKRQGINLKRKISLFNGITIIVGNVIGTGIFLSPKGVQLECGSPALSLIIWVVCGCITILGCLSYAELGTTITKSGGAYIYTLEAFGPVIAFLQMWITVIVVQPADMAILALMFGNYVVQPFFPDCDPPYYAVRLLAAACLLIVVFMNCWSVRYGTRIQDLFTIFKVLALLIITVTGICMLCIHGTSSGSFHKPWEGTTLTVGSIAFATYSGLYSFAGWDALNCVVEELQDPRKNLPKAIFAAVLTCTTIYLLTNVAYYAVLTPTELIATDAVAVGFAIKALGVVSWSIPIFVAMSVIGTLNSNYIAYSRTFYAGAKRGQLPSYLGMLYVLAYNRHFCLGNDLFASYQTSSSTTTKI